MQTNFIGGKVMQPVLEITNFKKLYRNGRGVKDLSLTVNRGDIVGLLGPNGSGKTTTMKAICGMTAPDSGTIKIFGNDVADNIEKALENAGFLIEAPAIYGAATAEQNLKMAAGYYNIGNDRIDKVLDIVKLSPFKNDRADRFSMGMKQRLGIALALLSNPGFLVLDEPFNGLDIEGVVHIRELILKLSEEYGTTFLISGHIAPELEKICTHTAVIHEGYLLAYDTLDGALKFHPSLEDYYLALVREAEGSIEL